MSDRYNIEAATPEEYAEARRGMMIECAEIPLVLISKEDGESDVDGVLEVALWKDGGVTAIIEDSSDNHSVSFCTNPDAPDHIGTAIVTLVQHCGGYMSDENKTALKALAAAL